MRSRSRLLRLLAAALVATIALLVAGPAVAQTAYVYLYEDWRYFAGARDPGAGWQAAAFDDSAWDVGEAPLGYAAPSYGINTRTHIESAGQTTYFRAAFDVADAAVVNRLVLRAAYANGVVVYVNGTEVLRQSMPAGTPTYDTAALPHVPTAIEVFDLSGAVSALRTGRNVIAVEVHQTTPISDIMIWAAHLLYDTSSLRITRGPYLQRLGHDSAVVHFRTNQSIAARVRYGAAPSALASVASEAAAGTEHEIAVMGLDSAARYYYDVGAEGVAAPLAGGDQYFMRTAPLESSAEPARVWVLGDSGTANGLQRGVRDAFIAYAGARPPDLVLMLGDNAYPNGGDEDHQYGIFENAYEATLRAAPVWPTYGNHEWGDGTNDSFTQRGPYFDAFTLPAAGEAGGVASTTESYYSFDYSNIHFVCLNMQDPTPEMLDWVTRDLDASTATWLVAYFHQPPYTKGTHDSDETSGSHAAARMAFGPVLEAHGADLVLAGHSHGYERSIMINGHYGLSTEFASDPARFTIDGGNGREDGDGAYHKPASRGAGQGTVYVVNGNSGGRGSDGSTFDHPVMLPLLDPTTGMTERGLRIEGSMMIDFDGARADVYYVGIHGDVLDHFTILKDGSVTPRPDGGVAPAGDGGAADAGGVPIGTPPSSSDGCSCRTTPGAQRSAASWISVFVVAAAVRLRRRHRRRGRGRERRRRRARLSATHSRQHRHHPLEQIHAARMAIGVDDGRALALKVDYRARRRRRRRPRSRPRPRQRFAV